MTPFLRDKKVFITGAGANIGRAIALEMAALGAHIYFAEKNATLLENLQRELSEVGATFRGFTCDVSSPRDLDAVLAALDEDGIVIEILVNNVGMHTPRADSLQQEWEVWHQAVDTNLLGPLYLTRALTDRMMLQKVKGNVIFISSIHQSVYFGDLLYSTCKAGLTMMISELAVSLASQAIRINGIAPGYTAQAPDGTPFSAPGNLLGNHSIRPLYIARAAAFLASDYFSPCTTGTVLTVDCGLSLFSFASHHQEMRVRQNAQSWPIRAARKIWRHAKTVKKALEYRAAS